MAKDPSQAHGGPDDETPPHSLAANYPRALVQALMPLALYWLVETGAGPTLHFNDECPAVISAGVEPRELDKAEHPLELAERLGAQPCGICLHMAESAIKDGFLYRCSSGLKSIGIYRDRVEYAGPAWLGLTFKQVTLAPGEITGVAFPTPAELVLDSRQGRFKFAFPRPAQAAVARAAFERLGWRFG